MEFYNFCDYPKYDTKFWSTKYDTNSRVLYDGEYDSLGSTIYYSGWQYYGFRQYDGLWPLEYDTILKVRYEIYSRSTMIKNGVAVIVDGIGLIIRRTKYDAIGSTMPLAKI